MSSACRASRSNTASPASKTTAFSRGVPSRHGNGHLHLYFPVAGLDPATHVSNAAGRQDVDARLKAGQGEFGVAKRVRKPELVSFASEDDWFDYRVENDPRFLKRIEQARGSLRTGRGTKLDYIEPSG